MKRIARGTADEAAEVLERGRDSRRQRTVSMLARAHLEAEDPGKRATLLLMAQDASNYTQFLPVTRLYLKTGEVDEAIRILSTIIERMLAGREERTAGDRQPGSGSKSGSRCWFANACSHSLVAA